MDAYKVYEHTNDGLTIILDLVPQAAVAVDNPKKTAFKYRLDERTPSAYLIAPDNKYPYWRLIDYGISNKPFSPVDLYIREKGMTGDRFHQAVHELAEQYGVEDEKISKSNRPDKHERPAKADEQEGQLIFETRDTFTQAEIALWGPNVTAEHLTTYGWKPVVYVGSVKECRVKECHSNDSYPIFAQECHAIDKDGKVQTFHKIYKPREYQKRYRFMYSGQVPKDYIFGLEALQCAFRKNGEKKLDAVFLVSGGSDAVNCLSMGGQAVWLNSETADLTEQQHALLYQYANRIYAIGDIDATGKECARRLALRYLDIHSITLPEDLMNRFHDNRGNLRKDLKDYIQIRPKQQDFDCLVRQARTAKFWIEQYKEKEIVGYKISPTNLNYFLELNGFFTLHDERHERPQYIRVEGMLVEEVFPKDIKNFLNAWCQEKGMPMGLQDIIHRSRDLPNKETSNLRELNLSFKSYTSDSQLCFFKNCWVEVTAQGITKHTYQEIPAQGANVWRHNVIDHNYVEHKPMFVPQRREDGSWGVTLTDDAKSDVLTYLRNSSRLYWRQEDEQNIPLSEQQRREQEQCLVAKLACIGYYMHRFRCDSLALAALLQDATLADDENECNGRSGKTFFIKCLKSLIHTVFIEARNPKIVEDKFLFDGVTEATDLVAIDECSRKLDFSCFFGKITGPFRAEEKGGHPFEIPSDKAPKMIFSTNYVIKHLDSSTEARLWPQIFSDYYHVIANNNDYKESRGIRDDFGYNLLDSDYPEEKWSADIALAMQCLQFFLSLPVDQRKIMPPMGTIERRTQQAIIGKDLKLWAEEYYGEGSEHLDVTENYNDVISDYRAETGDHNISPQVFTQKLKEWCNYAEHIHCYNPAELTEEKKDGGRIRKRNTMNPNQKDMFIHVRSYQWVQSQTPIIDPAKVDQAFKDALELEDDDEDMPF